MSCRSGSTIICVWELRRSWVELPKRSTLSLNLETLCRPAEVPKKLLGRGTKPPGEADAKIRGPRRHSFDQGLGAASRSSSAAALQGPAQEAVPSSSLRNHRKLNRGLATRGAKPNMAGRSPRSNHLGREQVPPHRAGFWNPFVPRGSKNPQTKEYPDPKEPAFSGLLVYKP